MLGAGDSRMRLTRSRWVWAALVSVMMVLGYWLSDPPHDNRLSFAPSCSQRTSELRKPQTPSPTAGRSCSPTRNIMFMKTHKTASSTFLNILFRFGEKHNLRFAFPDGRNDFRYPSAFHRSQVKGYVPGQCFNIVCNHMRFDAREVAQLLPEDTAYVTILRDPAAMLESAFHYYRSAIPLTWGIPGDDKLSAFLRDPRAYYTPSAYNSFYLRNLLMFDFGFDNDVEPDDPGVARVIRELAQRFHLVLLAEHFEESLVLLKDTLCWTTEDVVFFQLNARRSSFVSRLSPELRARALAWNGADWRLYRHFNASFWARRAAFGEERLRREVAELRRRNAELRVACVRGGAAVEAAQIRDSGLLPWQPLGDQSILGYNLREDVEPEYRELCRKMVTPEIQYLSELGVDLWLTKLWGRIKSVIFQLRNL